MGDGERKYYICLRCGHRFWSRAKKPQCSVCKSKRVMLYEDFLKLPEEEKQKLLGGFKVQQVHGGDEQGERVKSGGILRVILRWFRGGMLRGGNPSESPGESGGGDRVKWVNPPKSPRIPR
ncbi:hypothetical protein [Thermococcus sp. JCM 11816]|uniref:hypothetical protein n=1 Tax=Thermococcus sp. (strain JCM 11816 / KS-1) TaxID=1295125 RepID=UPI0006D22201